MAVTTGNDYDHIDIAHGDNATRHFLKDSKAREDLVVQQAAQPSSDVNKIWFPSTIVDEVAVPTEAEHEALAQEVNSLKRAVTSSGMLTFDPYFQHGYIDSNGKWASRTSGNPRCAVVPVTPGQSLKVAAGSTTTQIAALKTFSNPADTDAADFSAATDWTGVVNVTSGTTFTGTIPADANFIYVWLGNWSSLARTPAKFIVGGYDYMMSAVANVGSKADSDSPLLTGTPTAPTAASDDRSQKLATTEFVKNVALLTTHLVPILEDATDIDTLYTPGSYRVLSGTSAATMTGTPPVIGAGYKLLVIGTTQNARAYQFALINTATAPIRYRYYNGTGWSDWADLAINFNAFETSRNLMPIGTKSNTVQSVNTVYRNGLLTLTGTASGAGGKSNPLTNNFVLPAGTYTISLTYVNIKALSVFLRSAANVDIANVKNILAPETFTLAEPTECYVSANVTSGKEYSQTQVYIQIERGSQQTVYQSPTQQTTIDTQTREMQFNPLSAFSNIECAGDSLTWGAVYTSDSEYRQANKPYPTVMGHITGATMTMLATAGANASEWWTEYSGDISAKTNALAIIFLGTNGGLTDTLSTDASGDDPSQWANTHTGNYAKIVNAYLMAGYKVLLVKCFMTSASASLSTTNAVIQQIADRFGCGVVDNDYISDVSYHYTPDRLYANTLHYNDLGYAAMAHQIACNVGRMSVTGRSYLVQG